jgi:hypothetical protein
MLRHCEQTTFPFDTPPDSGLQLPPYYQSRYTISISFKEAL